jgi:uncharacterized iron-regulated membrane protein
MPARLRRILFWSHLACGAVAGVVILMMCVTGVALTYQKEMQWWADTRHYRAAPPADGGRASVAAIVASIRQVAPGATVTSIAWRAEPADPVAVLVGTRTLYVNPYTATVHGDGTGQGLRAFFTSMTGWHRYVALAGDQRPTGKAITGAANLTFLFIVLSGMYLWWPRTPGWAQIRRVIWFRGGVRAKARDFSWHNTIGFWSALPLAVIVYSATVISYPWSNNLVYRAMGEEPPASAAGRAGGAATGAGRAGRPAGAASGAGRAGGARLDTPAPVPASAASRSEVDALVDRAMVHRNDWAIVTLRVPASASDPAVFTIDRGDAGQPNLRGTLTMSAAGTAEKWEDFSALTPGRRLRTVLRFAHTGEVWGLTGQTIAGLASAGGAVLVYTGLALATRRLRAWLTRRRPRYRRSATAARPPRPTWRAARASESGAARSSARLRTETAPGRDRPQDRSGAATRGH